MIDRHQITVALLLSILVLGFSSASNAQVRPYLGATPKSESVAVQQSIINTVFPLAAGYGMVALFNNNTVQTVGATIAVYGIVSGPSSGNFYASDYLRGGLGALSRFGLALVLQDATRELFGNEFADALNVDDEAISFNETKYIVGSSLMAVTMVYNILTGPVSVREYNRSVGYLVQMESLPGRNRAIPVLTAQFHL